MVFVIKIFIRITTLLNMCIYICILYFIYINVLYFLYRYLYFSIQKKKKKWQSNWPIMWPWQPSISHQFWFLFKNHQNVVLLLVKILYSFYLGFCFISPHSLWFFFSLPTNPPFLWFHHQCHLFRLHFQLVKGPKRSSVVNRVDSA